MPKKRVLQFEAWSYSRLTDYERCAKMAWFKYLDPNRPKFVPNKAMQRGTEIHTKAEKYAIGTLKRLPKELELFEEEFKALRKIKSKLSVEEQLALTSGWSPSDWFGPDTWLRVKMDLMYPPKVNRLKMVDHKTGKVRPENEKQCDLYATAGFALFPNVTHIEAELWYLDWGEIVALDYTRKDDFENLKKYWVKRTKKMLADKTFKENPGNACTWCDFSKSKGGPCKF